MKAYFQVYWWRIAIGIALIALSAVFALRHDRATAYLIVFGDFVLQVILRPKETPKR
jgi:hypothetical protein